MFSLSLNSGLCEQNTCIMFMFVVLILGVDKKVAKYSGDQF